MPIPDELIPADARVLGFAGTIRGYKEEDYNIDNIPPGKVLLAGMKLARKLISSQPLQKFYEREEFPGSEKVSDDDLMTAAKQRGTTTFHLMGTCRMGPESDPTSVVDDQLRVRGMEALRVVDASIMPTMPSANLNASVLMIAEKAADMIRGRPQLETVRLPD